MTIDTIGFIGGCGCFSILDWANVEVLSLIKQEIHAWLR